MRAATWQDAGRIAPTTLAEPSPRRGEAVIEVDWCGICGSDLHAFKSGRGIDRHQVLGHELSGRVLTAPGVDGFSAGDRVVVRPVLQCGRCPRCLAGEVNLCERQILLGLPGPGRVCRPGVDSPCVASRRPAARAR
jgi:(R,R)-butanediol dehydrogenase/meso-butanediol dehydrogenase/diacetyl reductase